MNVRKAPFQRNDGTSGHDAPPAPGIDEGVVTSPAEIDARRAHHSLERAMQLAERGDMAAAITACRQSIALAHQAPEGYSALGLLLERAGDRKGAIMALQKAVQLAPGSALDRTSLQRLQSADSGTPSPFHFDDDELFAAQTAPDAVAEVAVSEAAAPVPTAPEVAVSEAAEAQVPVSDAVNAPVAIDARLPPTRAEIAAISPVVAAPVAAAPVAAAPVAAAPVAAAPVAAAPVTVLNQDSASVTPASSTVAPAPDANPLNTNRLEPTPLRPSTKPLVGNPAALDGSPFANPQGERRAVNAPVAQERRAPSASARYEVPPLSAPPASPFAFDPINAPVRAPLWAQLLRQPSFFGRTLPLIGVTLFSLGFLGWARARAVDNALARNPVTVSSSADSELNPNSGEVFTTESQSNTTPPSNAANPNGTFPISNVPGAIPPGGTVIGGPQPVVGAPAVQPVVPASVPPSAASNGRATSPRTAPRTAPGANLSANGRLRSNAAPSIPPAPVAPLVPATSGARPLVLPPPQITAPAPDEAPVRALPSNAGAPTPNIGSVPLRPGGAPGRGYVRVQGGRLGSSTLPQRPGATARGAEAGAGAAARTGQTTQAIERITAAINADPGDAGFRLQQRASLFLDNGDFSRAADDYQAAIGAYQDQINRGENVATARAGLRSARSGLNLALAAAGRNR